MKVSLYKGTGDTGKIIERADIDTMDLEGEELFSTVTATRFDVTTETEILDESFSAITEDGSLIIKE